MVTRTCEWSQLKIHPGKGKKFVAKDGKTVFLLSKKCASFYHNKTKAVKLTWTPAWRRFNKKNKIDETQKRKTKRTTRVQKAIVGMNLEEIKRRKDPKSDFRSKLRDDAKKEVADKKKKQIEKRRENRKAQNK